MLAKQIRVNWHIFHTAVYQLRWPLLGLLLVCLTNTMAFILWQKLPLLQAMAYTLNAITLNIAAESLPEPLLLQLSMATTSLVGVVSIASGASRILQIMSNPQEKQRALASTLRDHIIVCGIGKIGYQVVNELLAFGETVVVVNQKLDDSWYEPFRRHGVILIQGDARQHQVLLDAGVQRASAVVACTSDDLTNLDIVLDARDANTTVKIVLRMFDVELSKKIAKGFNINTAFSVSALSAPALAAAATRTQVDYSFRLQNQLLNVTTVQFPFGSLYLGKNIAQIEQETDCSFVGQHNDQNITLHPDSNYIIQQNDVFSVVGRLESVRLLHKQYGHED